MRGHVKVVDSVSLYQNDDKPYLASATRDGTLKIWSLDVNEFITSLDNKGVEVHANVIIDHRDKNILVSGDECRGIKSWSLENRNCIRSFIGSSGIPYKFEIRKTMQN